MQSKAEVWRITEHLKRSMVTGRGANLLVPNTPGFLSTPHTWVGIIPRKNTFGGNVGVVARSGTLTYEVVHALKMEGIGSSTRSEPRPQGT